MLIIKTAKAVEKITVTGAVPAHPDVRDFKPNEWSGKPIRPNRVEAIFQRIDNGEWTIATLTVFGFDVLKGGRPSDNLNCYREHQISSDGAIHRFTKDFDREQIQLTEWARQWAQVHLSRINDVTARADLDSDVFLGEPVNLDEVR